MIESLTEPALVLSKHDTEPMAAVRIDSPEMCGVEGCDKPAHPLTYCCWCHVALCFSHSKPALTMYGVATFCPECEKGAS